MLEKIHLKLFFIGLFFLNSLDSNAQVGIGTTNPNPSSILDVYATDKSLLIPRVANTSVITAPTNGMLIYDISSQCVKFYQNGSWSNCIGNNGFITTLDCVGATHNGTLYQGFFTNGVSSTLNYTGGNGGAHNGQTITSTGVPGLVATLSGGSFANGTANLTYNITGTPTSSGTASFSINIGGQTCTLNRTVGVLAATTSTLDCAGATNNGGLSSGVAASGVTSIISYTGGNGGNYSAQTISSTGVTGLSASLSAGSVANGSGTLTYTITGTPSTTGTASFAITLGGQSCTLTRTVGSIATIDCAGATNNGILVNGSAASGVSSVISYTGGAGASHSGQTVNSTGVTGLTATLAAGNFASGNGTLTYNITGTPTSTGTASFAINIGGLTCTLTRTVIAGSANFASNLNQYVFSANDLSIPINTQGTLAIGTTGLMPYTSGIGTYAAYTSPDVSIPAAYCEDGASDWTLGYSYAAGTFSTSGNITVTFITKKAGVVTAWTAKRVSTITTINFNCATVPWVVNATTYPRTVGLDEGGDTIRAGIANGGNTNGAAYDAATVNTPVQITLSEYNAILATVPSAVQTGISTFAGTGGYGNPFLNANSGLVTTTPANSYVVATAFKAMTSTSQFHILYNATYGSTATCLTNLSASQSYTANTIYYFAIKRPSAHIGNNIYLGAGSTPSALIMCTSSAGGMFYVNAGQTTSCPTPPTMSSSNGTVSGMIQFISTPVKSF